MSNVDGIRQFITDFNAKNHTLRNKGDDTAAYSAQVMYTERGPVEGVDNGDVSKLFYYKDGASMCSAAADAFYVRKYMVGGISSDVKDQSEGVIYVKGKDGGAGYLFAVEGGGKDETGNDATAKIKYVKKVIPWNEIIPKIYIALGVKLWDDTISQEAKDYVDNMDMNQLVNGYVDEDGYAHEPYSVKVFPNVADNVYVRLRLNPASLYCKNEGMVCFVNYTTNKVYIADDALTEAMNVLKNAHAFDTSYDRKIRDDLEDGASVQLPGCALPKMNTAGTLDQSEIRNYIETVRAGRVITYQGGGWSSGGDPREHRYAYGLMNIVLSPNTFTGSWSGSTKYYYKENQLGVAYRVCYYRDLQSLTPNKLHIINDPSFTVPPEDEILVKGHTPAFSNVPYTDPQLSFPAYQRVMMFNNDGTINRLRYKASEYGSWYDDTSICVGFNPVADQTGDVPTDFEATVSENYANWNTRAEQILMYKAPEVGQTISVNTLKEYKKLLPFDAFGDDQTSVHLGDVTDDELRDLSKENFSDKLDLEDEGTTVEAVDEIGIGAGFMHLYYTDADTVSEVYQKALVSQDLGDVIAKFYAGDLSKAIIDIYRLPFACSTTNLQDIKVSACTINGTQGYEQTNRVHVIDFGTVEIEPKFNDQRDYSPITRVTVFLPFSGYHNLDVDDMVNSQIHLKCRVDKMSGNGTYEIQIERADMDATLYTFPMSCRLEYPVSFTQSKNAFSAFLGLASGTAAMAAGGGAGGLVGTMMGGAGAMGALNAMKPVQARGGNIGDAAGWLSSLVPYIIINRPGYGEPEHFEQIAGRAANTDVVLGAVRGFTVIREVHIEGIDRATAWEKDEIVRLLKSGVIL